MAGTQGDHRRMRATSAEPQLHPVRQAVPVHRWALWLILAAGCDSRTSLPVGIDASAMVDQAMPAGGASGEGGGGNGAAPGTGGLTGSGGSTGTGGSIGTGGLTGSGGSTGTGGSIGTGGLVGSGGSIGTGGFVGTGGRTGSGGATGTGGSFGAGGLVGSGGANRTGGAVGAGGSAGTDGSAGAGGSAGSGGTLSSGGAGGSCANVTPCGGDVVGTRTVKSSCLTVSGDMDVRLLSLGCATLPVTGSLQVTGTWTAKADGTYVDNTTTTGSVVFLLAPSCLVISSVRVECSRVAPIFQSFGWATTICSSDASGKCYCSATANQSGGIGVVSPWASVSGTYRTSGSDLTVDDSVDYAYCVSGTTLTMTPKPTILPIAGTIALQEVASTGTGGATGTGGVRASGGNLGAGGIP